MKGGSNWAVQQRREGLILGNQRIHPRAYKRLDCLSLLLRRRAEDPGREAKAASGRHENISWAPPNLQRGSCAPEAEREEQEILEEKEVEIKICTTW